MKVLKEYRRNVSFADTDMAGVVHFTRMLCYVEEAEHDAMSQLGVPAMVAGEGGFPKVHIEADYCAPLRYRDEVWVQMRLMAVGEKSISWEFQLGTADRLAAEGKLVTAYIDQSGKGTAIPPEWRKTLVANTEKA